MGHPAAEGDLDVRGRRRADVARHGERRGVPGQRGIHVEQAVAHEVDLGALGFLGGAAIDADRAGCAGRLHHGLQCDGSPCASRAQHAVPAAVPVRVPRRSRSRPRLRCTPEVGQGVVLGQEGEHRATGALRPFADEGRGVARCAGRDGAETRSLELAQMHAERVGFDKRKFRVFPDLAGDPQDRLGMALHRRLCRPDARRLAGRRAFARCLGKHEVTVQPKPSARRCAGRRLEDSAPCHAPASDCQLPNTVILCSRQKTAHSNASARGFGPRWQSRFGADPRSSHATQGNHSAPRVAARSG